ncbi:hypothetical protein FMN50_07310 [Rhodobacterales bacterium]|nr:hypothetical protein FMN50_07310 [Rhodobacterales bacterium]
MPHEKSIKPRRETAESKAETTKRVSEEMMQTEAAARNAKTMRLRAARLAQEDTAPTPEPTKRRKK